MLPDGTLSSQGVLSFTPVPGDEGSYSFDLIASDGVATSTQTVSLEVTPDPLSTSRYSGTIRNTRDEPLEGLRITVGDIEVFHRRERKIYRRN